MEAGGPGTTIKFKNSFFDGIIFVLKLVEGRQAFILCGGAGMSSRLRKTSLIIVIMVFFLSISILFSHGESVNYYYDDLNRLIRIDYGDTVIDYTYDDVGNRELERIAHPPFTTASPAGGVYGTTQSVTLNCTDPQGPGCANIYYTTDGSTPTTFSLVYSSPVSISAATTLKYFARDTAGVSETVKTQIYTIDVIAPTTTASPLAGSYNTPQSVTLSCTDTGSGCDRIYYTTDGTTPTTSSPIYSTPLNISLTTTVKFFGRDLAGNNEAVKSETYTITTGTIRVIVQLKDSIGNPLSGGVVQYYSGGWQALGMTDTNGQASKELRPASYTFRMSYAFASQDKAQNISADPTVIFQTTRVAVQLNDSTGAFLDSGTVRYYAGGWRDFGMTSGGQVNKELLPANYSFRMTYGFTSQDKSQNIAADPTVIFQTTRVTVQLKDSTGALLDTGTVQYYSGGWRDFGTISGGQVNKELLPASYTFRLTYAFASHDKSQNIATDPTIVFQTARVTVQLKNSTGPLMDTGRVQYYSGGWRDFGTTSGGKVNKELLPASYTFRMTCAFASQDKFQNIAADPTILFQTGQVHSDSGSCTHYYAGGWREFNQDMELLPLAYTFRFNDGTPGTPYTISTGAVCHIH